MTNIDIGLSAKDKKQADEMLANLKLLVGLYTSYLQTHHLHCPQDYYTEISIAIDDIAEDIRTLDYIDPDTYREYSFPQLNGKLKGVASRSKTIETLARSHKKTIESAREVLKVAKTIDDQSTVHLVSDCMRTHEKTAWMLRAMVEVS